MSPHLRSSPPPPTAPVSIQLDWARRPEEMGAGELVALEPPGQTLAPNREKRVEIH